MKIILTKQTSKVQVENTVYTYTMTSFNVKTLNAAEAKSVDSFNNYLVDHSYVNDFSPSQADVEAVKKFNASPNQEKHPHVARWYKHISSFSSSEQSA